MCVVVCGRQDDQVFDGSHVKTVPDTASGGAFTGTGEDSPGKPTKKNITH